MAVARTGADVRGSLADAAPVSYWLDRPEAPEPASRLATATSADLVVVGGGFTGLWTALRAKERDPSTDVVLLEAGVVAGGATGRNGGFCSASLTHGLANGVARWPLELSSLERLGRANLQGIADTVRCYGIDCAYETTGELSVATQAWQAAELRELLELMTEHGHDAQWLDGEQVRAQVASPTYVGGIWDRSGTVLVDPARLAWGLRRACRQLGVRLHEHTPVTGLERAAGAVVARTPHGSVRTARVALATNAYPSLLRRARPYVVPVYDYVLVTEPLDPQQRATLRWEHRQGVGDSANQFHYYRLTADDRVLWGGYDAIYHYGSRMSPELDHRPASFALLARHFHETFPQLDGIRFTHAWGGAIDTCTRFSAFWGLALGGRVGYVGGYTGLGVGASRFGADTLLDLLQGRRTERTALSMVRRRPLPFPPEPVRSAGIALTKWSLDRADRRGGRRNAWLRLLDALGLGFDS